MLQPSLAKALLIQWMCELPEASYSVGCILRHLEDFRPSSCSRFHLYTLKGNRPHSRSQHLPRNLQYPHGVYHRSSEISPAIHPYLCRILNLIDITCTMP